MEPKDEQQIDFLCGEVAALGHADLLLHIDKNDRSKDPRREPFLKITISLVEAEKEKRMKEIWEILNRYYGANDGLLHRDARGEAQGETVESAARSTSSESTEISEGIAEG